MFPDDFETFIKQTHRALMVKYPHKDVRLHALGRTVKLAEEVGELASEVLSSLELQRKSKLTKAKRMHLENEWADTFFSLVLLAITLNVPTRSALERRIGKISSRIISKNL